MLLGSFLLFLVQPMVARLALPQLGGAPAVWNSAMLVYQALLLAGYAYAHVLQRLSIARQALVHGALFAAAALTLPIGLARIAPPAPGMEALWVPFLFLLSIGPVFFLVSAQAPLLQRWFAADPDAGDPYALYAASNLGSFAGLIAYPLLVEPNFSLGAQTIGWSVGYGLLLVLIATVAWTRRAAPSAPARLLAQEGEGAPIGWRRIALWVALAAVPSGLMLSTTTHLTTDIFAMPLLWVIPLGLYLLSYVGAFATRRGVAASAERVAPIILLLAGGMAAIDQSAASLNVVIAELVMLFVVATALHSRLYRLRPEPTRLTLFYLAISAGGALGGFFTAILAPLLFDWVWEHPLLVLAAAALVPQHAMTRWMERLDLSPRAARIGTGAIVALAVALSIGLGRLVAHDAGWLPVLMVMCLVAFCGVLVLGRRLAFVAVMLALMVGRGGWQNWQDANDALRERSYFGVYSVRETAQQRELAHGSTLHGMQLKGPGRALTPTTYYGPDSGVGLALAQAPALFGADARIGVVGLGTGTLACYRRPRQAWTFFELDPAVLGYSRRHVFTFLERCAPQARVVIGDARVRLAEGRPNRFDLLAIDAFSSDAIPLHLLTREALEVYGRALRPGGVLLIHISNRFIDLRPVLAALAQAEGWSARARFDPQPAASVNATSDWIALSATPKPLDRLAAQGDAEWTDLPPPAPRVWTDQFASVVPFIRWHNVLGS